MDKANADVLDRLFTVIVNRRQGDPDTSYVARQLQSGTSRIAQKVGEEAVETALAAVSGDEKGAGFGKRRSSVPPDDIVGRWRSCFN